MPKRRCPYKLLHHPSLCSSRALNFSFPERGCLFLNTGCSFRAVLAGKEQIRFLDSQLNEQKSYEGIVQTIERFFLPVVDFTPIDAVIEEALLQIKKKSGIVSINTLI